MQAYFIVTSSAGLADALSQVSASSSKVAWVAFTYSVAPVILVLQDDGLSGDGQLTVADVLQLTSRRQNGSSSSGSSNGSSGSGSISISSPMLISGPLPQFSLLSEDTTPAPATPGTLDLSGCVGCLVLSNDSIHGQMHIYLQVGVPPSSCTCKHGVQVQSFC